MDYTKNLITLSLALLFQKFLCPGVISLECGPPFVPINGFHSNIKQKYTPGDRIEYTCDKGYHRVGEKQSTCLTNGSWRGQMPFCDPALQLRDPVFEGNPKKLQIVQTVIDNNNKTCLPMQPGDGLQISLKDRAIIQVIKLFLKKGKYSLKTEISIANKKSTSFPVEGILGQDNWISFTCKDKIYSDSICIRAKERSMNICEVEIYGSDESSCSHPPSQLYIPNGNFFINRERAVLKCVGQKSKNYTHSICEDKKWKPIRKPFTCEGHSEGTRQNLVTIIVASAVSVCILLGCLIAALIFVYKRRNASVVVVMHAKEHYCRGGHCPSAPEEPEYASIIYSDLPLTPAQMRKFHNKVPDNLPDLVGYSDPVDEDKDKSGMPEYLSSGETKEYVQPQDALPSGNNQHLATLKESSFYGE